MKPLDCWVTGMLTAAALTGAAGADDSDAFQLSNLYVPDEVTALVAEDLNADGLKDFLIVHRKGLPPEETRWLSVFWQSAAGAFSTAADQSWELAPEATILDAGDVVGDERQEICFLTPSRVCFYPVSDAGYGTEPVELFMAESLTRFPAKAEAPLVDFVRDWNDDGIDDVAVFTFAGIALYRGDAQRRYDAAEAIEIEIDARLSPQVSPGETEANQVSGLRTRFLFPDLFFVDFNGDGRRDLIATQEDRVIAYLQDEAGGFSSAPDADRLFDIRTQQEKIEDLANLATVVHDLNGDGYADAVATKQVFKGISSVRGVLNIFWGSAGGYAPAADQKIISEGTASVATVISDVNGDGRLDLVLPSLQINLKTIVRLLLTRNLPIRFNIFLLRDDGSYPERPDFAKEVKLKIDFGGEQDTQTLDLKGDFNADGRKDFAFATDEDELAVYIGVEDGRRLFSQKPVAKIKVEAFGDLVTPDLNGDGYSDMYITYPVNEDRKGSISVLMNRQRL